MSGRTWLVTGANRGLGRAFVVAALEAGDDVVAGARAPETLDDLVDRYGSAVLPMRLDVASIDHVGAAVTAATERFGGVDVLVNNAGFGHSGAFEELSEAELRNQFEVNVFGVLRCTQAVLPLMRAQGSGHVVMVSSLGGVIGRPNLAAYAASKWAVEGMSEALAHEVAGFGIKVTILEPGPFRSDWNGDSMRRSPRMPEYDEVLAARREQHSGDFARTQPGDPDLAALALVKVVESENPPLRLLLGREAADVGPAAMRDRLAEWERWDEVARSADFETAG